MSQKRSLQRWDHITSALETDVSRLPESELFGEPLADERVAAMRQLIRTALQPQGRLPADSRARRELLRRTLRRRAALSGGISMSFSSPDNMSDSEVDAALRDLLDKSPLKSRTEKE